VWHSWEDFVEQGGGFVALHSNEVVGWCVLDGQSQSMYAIDIATEASYRGCRIASALAAAMIRWITQSGNTPYWECVESNIPSRRLADKCGLQVAFTYQLFGF
jgi:GNAT superfamily N-acetyltransferase